MKCNVLYLDIRISSCKGPVYCSGTISPEKWGYAFQLGIRRGHGLYRSPPEQSQSSHVNFSRSRRTSAMFQLWRQTENSATGTLLYRREIRTHWCNSPASTCLLRSQRPNNKRQRCLLNVCSHDLMLIETSGFNMTHKIYSTALVSCSVLGWFCSFRNKH